jgi:hypothetical protein
MEHGAPIPPSQSQWYEHLEYAIVLSRAGGGQVEVPIPHALPAYQRMFLLTDLSKIS